MIGTTITDAYELSMFITMPGKTTSRTGIKQAVHTALGNVSVPDYIQTFPHDQAFGKVLEQMILRALQGMQQSGELAKLDRPDSVISRSRSVTRQYWIRGGRPGKRLV